MPSWLHLGVGFGVLGLLLLGASKATSSGVSGGGERLVVRTTEVDGKTYHVIRRDESIIEVFSPDDPEAWILFDTNAPGDTVRPIAAGKNGKEVIDDMQKFPRDLLA